jgi:hypothetical protein
MKEWENNTWQVENIWNAQYSKYESIRKKYTFWVHDHSELHIGKFPKSSNNNCDRLFTRIRYIRVAHGVQTHEVRWVFSSAILSKIQSAASKVSRQDESSELQTPSDYIATCSLNNKYSETLKQNSNILWGLSSTKNMKFNFALDKIQNNQW